MILIFLSTAEKHLHSNQYEKLPLPLFRQWSCGSQLIKMKVVRSTGNINSKKACSEINEIMLKTAIELQIINQPFQTTFSEILIYITYLFIYLSIYLLFIYSSIYLFSLSRLNLGIFGLIYFILNWTFLAVISCTLMFVQAGLIIES